MRNNAQPAQLPRVPALARWRGRPLTREAAEDIYVGWFGREAPEGAAKAAFCSRGARAAADEPSHWGARTLRHSWIAAAGQNPAYEHFPCQFQLFVRTGNARRGGLRYNPAFKVFTLEDTPREVWRTSDYSCRPASLGGGTRGAPTPGVYELAFSDSGVVSRELWRVAGAADDLSWALFYYSGAAVHAGQTYVGAMLATPDGAWPAPRHAAAVEAACREAGVELWELDGVRNTCCDGVPVRPTRAVRYA